MTLSPLALTLCQHQGLGASRFCDKGNASWEARARRPSLLPPASLRVLGPLSPLGCSTTVSLPYRSVSGDLGFAIHHIFQKTTQTLGSEEQIAKWDPLAASSRSWGHTPRRKWGMVSRGCCVHRTDDVLLSSEGPFPSQWSQADIPPRCHSTWQCKGLNEGVIFSNLHKHIV